MKLQLRKKKFMTSLENFNDKNKNIFLAVFSIIKNLLDNISYNKKTVNLPITIIRCGFKSWLSDESAIINNVLFEKIYNDNNAPIVAIRIYDDSGTMVQFSRNRTHSLVFDHINLKNGSNNINIYISNLNEDVIIFNFGDGTSKNHFLKETIDVETKIKFIELINIVNKYIENKYYKYNGINYKTCKSWIVAKKFLRDKDFRSFSMDVVIGYVKSIIAEITGTTKIFDNQCFKTSDVNNLLNEIESSL